ncbi:MAG: hypothetical protein KGK10_09790 [Rhodospirillales bacterium]|nr:hypothetical protein [Rhodospirillales bacterium]
MPEIFAGPAFGINHILAYGQSLATGWEGAPPLTRRPWHDTLMLGRSVRAAGPEWSPAWEPLGGPVLRQLVATAQLPDGTLLDDVALAGVPDGAVVLGETVLEAALGHLRGRMLAADPAAGRRLLLGSVCGVGGRSLEQLSRGADPELFARLRSCVTVARTVARAWGKTYGIPAVLFLQGEQNSWGIDGAASDRATYRALLARLHRDIGAELAAGIAGQASPPALVTYQTGGAYASDDMAVPQAQLDVALETPGVFMAAPVYPLPDWPSGHLRADGYRWLGVQFGKVLASLFVDGEPWRPLHPLGAVRVADAIVVSFHVPVPPLAFGRPFLGTRREAVPDQGFTVMDAAGPVPITAIGIVGPDRVLLRLARPLLGPARLRYADPAHHGRGGLHDSDARVAEMGFAGNDLDPSEAGLLGTPYPLANWCAGFDIAVDG